MRVLVDTNILLRSAQPNHPLCHQATHAVSKLLRQNDSVFFCPQNIAGFWNVATRPVERNGLGFSYEEVLREVTSMERRGTRTLRSSAAFHPAVSYFEEEPQRRAKRAHLCATCSCLTCRRSMQCGNASCTTTKSKAPRSMTRASSPS